jgi:MoxR-like ATPase
MHVSTSFWVPRPGDTLAPMADEVAENQREFLRLAGGSPALLEDFLERVLTAKGKVRYYTTSDTTPSRQLKNKLSQAATAHDGVMFLDLPDSESHQKAKEALVERWGTNDEWPKTVSAVALCYPSSTGARQIKTVVTWRRTPFADRIKSRLFPDVEIVEAHRPTEPGTANTHGNDAALAELLCIDEQVVRDWVWLLKDRRALIFYGPPGTSKTFVARRLAEHLQPQPQLRRLVQLHPSFGYEEFFEGYRPAIPTDDDDTQNLQLRKADGPLRDLVRAAEGAPDADAIMVLDEVNRGNLPRVFGELFFLIEYRDAEVSLMYSPGERFRMPKNVLFIGTMNTADRSVAVLDQALRRRFHFVPLFPGEAPVDRMLSRFLQKHRPEMVHAAKLLDLANEKLPRHFRIGPSHLMRKDLDDAVLEKVWRYSVLPSIAEQFFDREEELDDLSLAALKSTLTKREAEG